LEKLIEYISNIDEKKTLEEVKRLLAEGTDPLILVEALREGMSIIGERFESGEYFLSELIMSAEIFKEAAEVITPYLKPGSGEHKGTIVIGTVQGDIHYIGKNIVATLLRCEGYEVHDLGEDVKPEAFVEKVKETGAKIVGLSALLTVAFDAMKATVEKLKEAGLRDQVKVIIGGAPVNESVVDYCGADAYGKDASEAVKLANSYLS
jgi:corrinoid protein of di/trimethylamine methyltransferase